MKTTMTNFLKPNRLSMLVLFLFAAVPNANAVTCADYDQVQLGMLRSEVVKLLGEGSERIWGRDMAGAPPVWIKENGDTEYVKWKNSDHGYLQVGFKDGKVLTIVGSNLPGKSMKNPAACKQ